MLILTLTSLSPSNPSKPETRYFSENEVIVGRGTGIGWTLKDPDRELSRRHFIIRLVGDSYWVEDNSTNGVSLNDTALHTQQQVKLKYGDIIRAGHYQFVVTFDQNAMAAGTEAADPFSLGEKAAPTLDLFSGLDEHFPTAPAQTDASHPTPGVGALEFPDWLDHDLDGGPPHTAVPGYSGKGGAPRATESNHVPSLQDFMSAPTVERVAPPLVDVQGTMALKAISTGHPPTPEPHQTLPPVPFAAEEPAAPSDVGADDEDPFAFLNDFGASPPTPRPAPRPTPSPIRPPSPPPPPPPIRPPSPPPPLSPPAPPAPPPPSPPSPPPPIRPPSPPPLARAPHQPRPAEGRPIPPLARAMTARPSSTTAATTDDALRALCRGAGLDPAAISETDGLAVMERAGQILREAIDGMITILNARNMIKRDLRMERTVLQPIDNNPLKFSRNTEQTLTSLLDRPKPGFIDPRTATRGAAQDILAHEMALIGAMQAALNNLLERFRPENLTEQIQADHPLEAVIPSMRKARYWELYEKDYRKIADDMANNFNGVFGTALADAYQTQLAEMEEEDKNSNR